MTTAGPGRRSWGLVAVAVALLAIAILVLVPRGARSAGSAFVEHKVATEGGHPFGIAKGADGRVWYTLDNGGLEAMTTAGTPTAYPDATTGGGGTGIAATSSGTLAVLEGDSSNYTHGSVSEVGTDGTRVHGPGPTEVEPNQVTEASDAYLYWTSNSTVCRATAAALADYSCRELNDGTDVGGDGIAAGSDGALWIAERTNNEIYRVTTNGQAHNDYPLPHAASNPSGITAGPDGALWFTETLGNRIGRIATDGTITEFDLPNANSDPTGITAGPDGALWFTEPGTNRIGRITTSGQITEHDIPTANSGAHAIVTGADGKLWFTENSVGQIGVYDPTATVTPPPAPPKAAVATSTTAPAVNRLMTFDPRTSLPGAGGVTRYAYDFDNSGRFQAVCPPSAPVAFKTWDTPGSHLVGLRVFNSAGASATTHVAITAARAGAAPKAHAALNPALLGLSHFWCGQDTFRSRLDLSFLPHLLTSDVRAVGVDVTQGVVPDPPRPSALSFINANLAAKFLIGRARPRDTSVKSFGLNNDEQDPRTHRITWLQRYGATVVRVYAAAQLAPNGKDVPNVQMKLYGFRDGHELPGSPLLSQTGPLDVKTGPPFTTHAMRVGYSPVDGNLPAFTYTLPHDWVDSPGNVAMLAVPTLVGGRLDRQCSTLECKLNQQAGSGDFQFSDTGLLIVRSVAMTASGDPALPSPSSVFDTASNLSPVAIFPSPYQGTVDITPITTCKAGDTTQQCTNPNGWVTGQIGTWDANNQIETPGNIRYATIGIHKNHGNAQGYSSWPGSCTDNSTWGGAICESKGNDPVSQVEVNRPYTSVAHEMFHDVGRPHADDSTSGCGGNGEGKPDSKGDLQSIVLDRHPNSGGSLTNPYLIRSPGLPGQPASLYDVMSYCANNAGDPDSAFSSHNWDEVAGEWIFFLKRAAASSVRAAAGASLVQAAPGSLQVSGVVEPDRTTINQVAPASGQTLRAVKSSPVHAVVRNGSGQVVGDAALSVTTGHLDSSHHGKPATPVIAFDGVVPARSGAQLSILSGGRTVATRARSKHAPKARLLSPRKGTIGGKRTVTVRWTASDADHDALLTNVDYSADKGRHWHAVYTTDRAVHQVKLSSRYFTGSKDARLRLRVSDGFNQTSSKSGRLRAVGRAPTVTITAPKRNQRFLSDASVYVQGTAFDDAFRMLSGKRLTWFAGKRRLGHGGTLNARNLPPGKVRLRLVARDRNGRSGSASVLVRVSAARPFFTTLSAPKKLGRKARTVKLKVATNVGATLRAGGQRYAVSSRTKTLRIKVKPGQKALKLSLRLAAHKRTATQTLTVPRP